MTTPVNMLDVPEITCYSRRVVDGLVIVRYLVRDPGAAEWRPVELIRVATPDDTHPSNDR